MPWTRSRFPSQLLAGAALATALGTAGCHHIVGADAASVDSNSLVLMGRVVDENGAPVPSATVGVAGQRTQVTGADASFAVAIEAPASQRPALRVEAPGYSAIIRPLGPRATANLNVGVLTLRQTQAIVSQRLPAAGEPPMRVDLQRGNGGVTLQVEAGQLVDPNGVVAQGEVDVALQYWHPQEPLESAPAVLVAQYGDQNVPLTCFGMAGVEIRQGETLLAVAPEQTVALIFRQPPELAELWGGPGPELYSLDEDAGLWRHEGGIGDGKLVFDPARREATAHLPHLSFWNVDGTIYPSNGGCVTGRALNACDPQAPLANTAVQIYFLSHENLKDFRATTGSDGRYCVATPISDYLAIYNAKHNDSRYQTNYVVTGGDINNTSMCNPLPQNCRTCNPFYETLSTGDTFCNQCVFVNPALYDQTPGNVSPDKQYRDTCSPSTPVAYLKGCSFCRGNSPANGRCTLTGTDGSFTQGTCTELGDVHLKSASCQCGAVGQTCGPGGQCCPSPQGTMTYCDPSANKCTACSYLSTPFSLCGSDRPCCTKLSDPPLTCLDNVCVPKINL